MDTSDPIPVEQARAIVTDVESIKGVAELHPGDFGEAALLYPGERIHGLRLHGGRLEVRIVVDLQALDSKLSLDELATAVRFAVQPRTDFPVDVVVADAIYRLPQSTTSVTQE